MFGKAANRTIILSYIYIYIGHLVWDSTEIYCSSSQIIGLLPMSDKLLETLQYQQNM